MYSAPYAPPLCVRLVLDVLSGKTSRDYGSGIKVDENFETTVHEVRTYFGFFKFVLRCESILRFYSYNVSLHLWDRIFKMFPELRVLVYTDDETTIGRLSQVLKLGTVSKSVFNSDDNLDLNMGKTMILTKDPTASHVYERDQRFLQNDPDLSKFRSL